MGAENYVHIGIAFFYLPDRALFLHHTAAERNDPVGISVLFSLQMPQAPVEPLIRVIPYGTGIKDNKVGTLLALILNKAYPFQDTRKLLGIPCVHLTPEGSHMIGGPATLLCFKFLSELCRKLHKIKLSFRLFLRRLYINVHIFRPNLLCFRLSPVYRSR